MKIKDIHPDIVRYLENDCYCQYEVYDLSGFFYQLVKPEEECALLGENEKFIIVIYKEQLLAVAKEDNKIVDITRVDATENNTKELSELLKDKTYKIEKIDEHQKGATKKALEEILSISDAIMISR